VGFEDADGLIERAWGFVIDSVQVWKTSGRVQIIPAFLPWIAYLRRAEKGGANDKVMPRACVDEPHARFSLRARL
jgi:hypothetical protein